jgi:hypothetical protein
VKRWLAARWRRHQEKREKRRYAQMMVVLTLDPVTLEQVKKRLTEDQRTLRRHSG